MKRTGEELTNASESGMTLIEVMVSLTMLGVVLVMLGQGLTLGIRLNSESKTKVTNLGITKQVTENLKSQLQISPDVFDNSTVNSSTYYATFNRTEDKPMLFDADGVEMPATAQASEAAFQVFTSVADWTDSAGDTLTDSAGNVLLKVLDVRVVSSAGAMSSPDQEVEGSMRETTMRVEITRPAA